MKSADALRTDFLSFARKAVRQLEGTHARQ